MLLVLLLATGCHWFSGGGTSSVPGLAGVLKDCDTTHAALKAAVTGTWVEGVSGEHELKTTATLGNPKDSTVTWKVGSDSSAAVLKGADLTGTATKDSAGDYRIDLTTQLAGKTLSVTGTIGKNPNPPPPCTGKGTWNLPGAGAGDWSF